MSPGSDSEESSPMIFASLRSDTSYINYDANSATTEKVSLMK